MEFACTQATMMSALTRKKFFRSWPCEMLSLCWFEQATLHVESKVKTVKYFKILMRVHNKQMHPGFIEYLKALGNNLTVNDLLKHLN